MKYGLLALACLFYFSCSMKRRYNIDEYNVLVDSTFSSYIFGSIDSNNYIVDSRYRAVVEQNTYQTIKFFRLDDTLFFTGKFSFCYPNYEWSDNSYYINDIDCGTCFELMHQKVIIMDYLESDGYGLFNKSSMTNNLCKEYKYFSDSILHNTTKPMLSQPHSYSFTVKVFKSDSKMVYERLDSIIVPSPYSSEVNSVIQIIEDDESINE